jgi:biotin---protein ligase
MEADPGRVSFLMSCLAKLGLEVNQNNSAVPSLSSLHLSCLDHAEVSEVLFSWNDIITIEEDEEYIKSEQDTFRIERKESRWSISELEAALPVVESGAKDGIVDYTKVVKRLIPHEHGWPDPKQTPSFNHALFFNSLKAYRKKFEKRAEEWGNILMYGEVLTSTNTILEK